MRVEQMSDVIETPSIWLAQGIFGLVSSLDDFTTCTATALKQGFYNGLIIITPSGQMISLSGAKRLQGSRLSALLNRLGIGTLKVELLIASTEETSTNHAKEELLESLRSGYWDGRDDTEELQHRVEHAQSIPELVRIVQDVYQTTG